MGSMNWAPHRLVVFERFMFGLLVSMASVPNVGPIQSSHGVPYRCMEMPRYVTFIQRVQGLK